MKFWLILLLALPLAATAGVYRSVDAHGNVTYSDTPGTDSEAIEVPPITTYEPPSYRKAGTGTAGEAPPGGTAPGYTLKILRPAPGATLRSNSGRLEVELAVAPDPKIAGHKLMYRLDNQTAASTSTPRFALLNLQRGDHSLSVWVSDAEGKQLGNPQTVQFKLMRGSGLFHPVPGNGGEGSGVQQAPRAPMAPQAPRPNLPKQYTPTPSSP
jgi:hypothetical protein